MDFWTNLARIDVFKMLNFDIHMIYSQIYHDFIYSDVLVHGFSGFKNFFMKAWCVQ